MSFDDSEVLCGIKQCIINPKLKSNVKVMKKAKFVNSENEIQNKLWGKNEQTSFYLFENCWILIRKVLFQLQKTLKKSYLNFRAKTFNHC